MTVGRFQGKLCDSCHSWQKIKPLPFIRGGFFRFRETSLAAPPDPHGMSLFPGVRCGGRRDLTLKENTMVESFDDAKARLKAEGIELEQFFHAVHGKQLYRISTDTHQVVMSEFTPNVLEPAEKTLREVSAA